MNIEQAKSIPLDELLQRLGFQPDRERGGRKWYRSPFRTEKTASFALSKDGRGWYDFGEGVGGNIIDLAMRIGNCSDVKQALSWLDDATGHMAFTIPTIRQRLPVTPEPPAYTLIGAQPFNVYSRGSYLSKSALYLGSRGINAERVAPYLRDVTYAGRDGKKRYGFGMPNVSGGYELRRSGDWMKTAVGHKDVSVFNAEKEAAPWHCFYSMIDFCTFLTVDKPPVGAYHYLIINSDALVGQREEGPSKPERLGHAEKFIENAPSGWMIHYPHNDDSGQRAYHSFLEFLSGLGWDGGDRAHLYEGFKDWTEAREKQLGLTYQVAKPAVSPALKNTPKI